MDVSARENLAADLLRKYVRDGLVYQLENFDSQTKQTIALPEAVWNLELITLECCFEENAFIGETKTCCSIGKSTATFSQLGSQIRNEYAGVCYRLSQYYRSAWKRMDNTQPFDRIATSISQSVNVNNPKVEYNVYEKGSRIGSAGQSATSVKLTDFKNMYLGQGIFYHSIRIYGRILSDDEVKQNWLIDEGRLGH